ncbi:MAG: Ig-like domain-containing protein [Marinilabiliales bacterium]|nr:Ig-like domain-containing protein [Marinilabiliales bacterium]
MQYTSLTVNGKFDGFVYTGSVMNPLVRVAFSAPVNASTAAGAIALTEKDASSVSVLVTTEKSDSVLIIKPSGYLRSLTSYQLSITSGLKSKTGASLMTPLTVNLTTAIDSSDKYPVLPDDSLLLLIQKMSFRYFWDSGHPVSGLARERLTSGDVVTSGGSGFGIMAILSGIERKFITRAEGLMRLQTMTDFLSNKASRFHGAFPHWMNGTSGIVIPFGTQDNGADLVETSYLMMGLLTARQYFDGQGSAETQLRQDISKLWNAVEWDWFRRNGGDALYWHWSPDYGWAMNMPIQGWNECLITYVLAASSTTHGIPKSVYDSGFARNGAMANKGNFYGIYLPLGTSYGGPLFFAHYSFLGINPFGLKDDYADYQQQVINHTKINQAYCIANPLKRYGYSDQCWGLTASDIRDGYTASSPTNDVGVIAPTAAISSLPYLPNESMKAIRFFYYKLGNKIFGSYGFSDAFNLTDIWFADSYLAIDQGPQIIMIENYRTGLLWKLFMAVPEVKAGMTNLGFKSPHL